MPLTAEGMKKHNCNLMRCRSRQISHRPKFPNICLLDGDIFPEVFIRVKFSLNTCLTWQTSIELLSNMILCWHFSCHCTFLASLAGGRRFQQPCTPPVSLHNSQHAASTRLSGHEPLTWTVHTLFWIFRYPQYTVHNIYNILLCI